MAAMISNRFLHLLPCFKVLGIVFPPQSPCPGGLGRPGQEKHSTEFYLIGFGPYILEGSVSIVCV